MCGVSLPESGIKYWFWSSIYSLFSRIYNTNIIIRGDIIADLCELSYHLNQTKQFLYLINLSIIPFLTPYRCLSNLFRCLRSKWSQWSNTFEYRYKSPKQTSEYFHERDFRNLKVEDFSYYFESYNWAGLPSSSTAGRINSLKICFILDWNEKFSTIKASKLSTVIIPSICCHDFSELRIIQLDC